MNENESKMSHETKHTKIEPTFKIDLGGRVKKRKAGKLL